MARYAYVYLNHTHLYNWSAPSCYFTKAALIDLQWSNSLYSASSYSYWASFYDAYGCLRHAHYRYWLQLPYNLFNQLYGVYITPHHATSY